MRPDWDTTFLEMATVIAKRSTCLRAPDGVGAVVVERASHLVLGVGYAGSLPSAPHCVDVGCLELDGVPGCQRTVHAELNAILHMRQYAGPKTLYCTLSPCIKCLQTAITAGVTRVVFSKLYRINAHQVAIAAQSNVEWVDASLGKVREVYRG